VRRSNTPQTQQLQLSHLRSCRLKEVYQYIIHALSTYFTWGFEQEHYGFSPLEIVIRNGFFFPQSLNFVYRWLAGWIITDTIGGMEMVRESSNAEDVCDRIDRLVLLNYLSCHQNEIKIKWEKKGQFTSRTHHPGSRSAVRGLCCRNFSSSFSFLLALAFFSSILPLVLREAR